MLPAPSLPLRPSPHEHEQPGPDCDPPAPPPPPPQPWYPSRPYPSAPEPPGWPAAPPYPPPAATASSVPFAKYSADAPPPPKFMPAWPYCAAIIVSPSKYVLTMKLAPDGPPPAILSRRERGRQSAHVVKQRGRQGMQEHTRFARTEKKGCTQTMVPSKVSRCVSLGQELYQLGTWSPVFAWATVRKKKSPTPML